MSAEELLRQPLHSVADLSAEDVPIEPGVYAWYRRGRLFYVGESHRGLRSRVWGNHVRGNARGSTLRNKIAKAFDFLPTGARRYGRAAERSISAKLQECDVRFLVVDVAGIEEAQADLIRELDPPMNDHPGEVPRWRIDEVREVLSIGTRPTRADAVSPAEKPSVSASPAHSQRVTASDIRTGQIRFPRPAKRYFPPERGDVLVVLRGVEIRARYDPRAGPDRERSAVLRVGKANLEALVDVDEVLSISLADKVVRLD